jgi:hypothetical protein
MDNCFGGLFSLVPAVITIAGTFLWICKKSFLLSSVTFFRLLQLTVWKVMKVLDAEAVYPVSSCDKAWPGKILFDRVNKT